MGVAIYSIFTFLALGYFAQKMRMLGNKQGNILLGFLLNFALPSAIFNGVYHSNLDSTLLLIFLSALSFSLISGIFGFYISSKVFKQNREISLVISLLITLHNTLFLGVPMVEGVLGQEFARKAILFDQFCTGIPVAIIAPLILSLAGKSSFSVKAITTRLFYNPLFLSMISAFVLKAMPFSIPEFLFAPINSLALCATPVALFAIGVQLKFSALKKEWKNAIIVLFFGMGVAPLLFIIGIYLAQTYFGLIINNDVKMSLIEISMPPLISAAAIIAKAGLNKDIAFASVVLGIFLSAFVVKLWLFVLESIILL